MFSVKIKCDRTSACAQAAVGLVASLWAGGDGYEVPGPVLLIPDKSLLDTVLSWMEASDPIHGPSKGCCMHQPGEPMGRSRAQTLWGIVPDNMNVGAGSLTGWATHGVPRCPPMATEPCQGSSEQSLDEASL